MKNYSFTTRNVTAGQRNDAGEMVLRVLGDVTLTLEGMLPTELSDWDWAAAGLNTRGWDEEQFLLTVRGWKVVHPEAGVVGILLQGAGTRVHVEWYDVANGDFFTAQLVRNLRHGAAAIVNARQHAGQGLPVDVVPEPVKAPASVRPVWLKRGTVVRYHGSLAQIAGGTFRVEDCYRTEACDLDCDGYALYRLDEYWPCAVHVGIGSVTALDAEEAAAV
ncbi:hypothetical protein ACUXZZ_45345 (plasmid) [Streptomyces graminifolii]|uniref:hypothetical protein n=1 Tax=Streptomyces graminifolii TaxID=1266771 RepID=UPI0040583EDA